MPMTRSFLIDCAGEFQRIGDAVPVTYWNIYSHPFSARPVCISCELLATLINQWICEEIKQEYKTNINVMSFTKYYSRLTEVLTW